MKNPKLSDVVKNTETIRKYEIDLHNGRIKSDGPEDHARAMEALEKLGPISKGLQLAMDARDFELAKASVPVPPPAAKTHSVQAVVDMWLAERAKKNGERTVTTKGYHLADFMRSAGSTTDINALTKATVVKYKDGLSKAGQTGKTIDNKLMSIRDMFKYALGHGLYTCQNANPVDGLFVLTKTERVSKNEPYQPFEKAEIQRFFEPSAYLPRMDAPDLFWGPLLGVTAQNSANCSTCILEKNRRFIPEI